MNIRVKQLPAVAIIMAFTIALLPLANAYALSASVGSLVGSITSAHDQQPLIGVTVRLIDMNTAEVFAEIVSGEDGTVSLADIPFGLYQVSVVAPEGYMASAGPLVLLDENTDAADLEFALEPMPTAGVAAAQGIAPPGYVWVLILVGAAAGTWALVKTVTDDSTG